MSSYLYSILCSFSPDCFYVFFFFIISFEQFMMCLSKISCAWGQLSSLFLWAYVFLRLGIFLIIIFSNIFCCLSSTMRVQISCISECLNCLYSSFMLCSFFVTFSFHFTCFYCCVFKVTNLFFCNVYSTINLIQCIFYLTRCKFLSL